MFSFVRLFFFLFPILIVPPWHIQYISFKMMVDIDSSKLRYNIIQNFWYFVSITKILKVALVIKLKKQIILVVVWSLVRCFEYNCIKWVSHKCCKRWVKFHKTVGHLIWCFSCYAINEGLKLATFPHPFHWVHLHH